MVLPFFYIDPIMMGGYGDYGGYGGYSPGSYATIPYSYGGGQQKESFGNTLLSGVFTAIGLGVGLALAKNRNNNFNNYYNPYYPGFAGPYGGYGYGYGSPLGYNSFLWI